MGFTISGNSGGGRPNGIFIKLIASLFLLIFLAMGIFFLVLFTKAIFRDVQAHFWKSAEAVVISSAVAEDAEKDTPYRFDVLYRYAFGGRNYISTQYGPDPSSSDYSEVVRLCDRPVVQHGSGIANRHNIVTPVFRDPLDRRHHASRRQLRAGVKPPRLLLSRGQDFYVGSTDVDRKHFHCVPLAASGYRSLIRG